MTKMHQKVRTTNGQQVMRVTSAVRRFTPQLLEGLETALAEDGWDLPAECIEALEQALGRVLESRLERLGDTVDTRRQGVQEGRRLRRQRDEAAREVYRLVVRLRNIVRGMGGAEAEKAFFGPGKTPREPKRVAEVAWELHNRLQSDGTRRALSESFGGHEVLDGWIDEVTEPLARLYESIDRVRLLEVDESAAVHEVRQSRESMQRAKKNALKVLEGLFGLAERDDLADRLRFREPERRDAETPAASRAATTVGSSEAVERPPATVAEPAMEVLTPSQLSGHAGELPEASHDLREPGEPKEPEVETVAAPARELVSARRAGSETAGPRPASPHLGGAEAGRSGAPVHPVRKVLRWFSVTPHPVETPDKPGVSTDSREAAA